MAILNVDYCGLELKSPIILASSGITKDLSTIRRAEKYGAGGVVIKTAFEEPLMAQSPTPRFSLIHRGKGTYRSSTNYSYEQGSEYNIDKYCNMIKECKDTLDIKIIGSIGCNNNETWQEWAKKLEDAGADAIELNLSCPHSNLVMQGHGMIDEIVKNVVPLVKKTVNIPVMTKMTPQLSNPVATAINMEKAGSDGVVAFSRFLGLEMDIESEEPIMHGGFGGHGGPWAIHYALRWITQIYKNLNIPISASGGVVCWEDAVKYILSGASTVQVCFLIYHDGYEVIEKLNNSLLGFMEKKGYERINDFRGNIVNKILGLREVDRRKNLIARIDENKCVNCGRCLNICIYDGISKDEKPYINDSCDGCGLCPYICPSNAISMKNI